MIRLAIAFLLFGLAMTVVALREQSTLRPLQEHAQETSLKSLLGRGAAARPLVSLTEFEFTDRFAFAEKSLGRGWRAAWFPVVPPVELTAQSEELKPRRISDGPVGPTKTQIGDREGLLPSQTQTPNQVRALIMSVRVSREADLRGFVRQRQFEARVSLASESLERRDRELLQQKFPGIELDQCLILQADEELRGSWLFWLLAATAGLCYATSVGLMIASRRRQPPAPSPTKGQADQAAEQVDAWQQALAKRQPPA